MSSVTTRIKEIQQPRGGYLKPSLFEVEKLVDETPLSEEENIHASIIGMVVDYLSRYIIGESVEDAFSISYRGAERASVNGFEGALDEAEEYLDQIHGLDDLSIISACKMVTFDVWYRNLRVAQLAKSAAETNPDIETIQNIRVMVNRTVSFWEKYGPIIKSGFTFETDGYTQTVNTGDGDFLTSDTIWDFKVSKSKPTTQHTLQLLMYWIMGQHSCKAEFKDIKKLGIFNPRLNIVYILNTEIIDREIIETVESDIICY